MISARAVNSARARLAAARHDHAASEDGGFALLLVMLITAMVLAALTIALVTVVPNSSGAATDQQQKAALDAAYAGIEDFLAFASSTNGCRTTACSRMLNTTSAAQARTTTIANTNGAESFSWSTEAHPTSNYYVRVHSTGTDKGATQTLTADIALTNPFLAYGYYSDYETQAADYIDQYYNTRTVDLTDSTTASNVGLTAPTSLAWNAPSGSSICNQHWYADTLNGVARQGRAAAGGSNWSQSVTYSGGQTSVNNTCDVNFVTGMTFDGPVYTRDAMLISDSSTGGLGPVFKQPVSTLWGSSSYNSPAPGNTSQPWRMNASGGAINSPACTSVGVPAGCSYSPSNVGVTDLQLPVSIATSDLPDDACVYTGPTRVVLNNGNATITSPLTRTKNAASNPNCYPASVTNGIVGFTLNYATIGDNTIVVRNLGNPLTTPPSGAYNTTSYCGAASTATECYWPATGQKSTSTASASNTVFYLANTGTATPDPASSVAPDSGCTGTSSTSYSAAASAACAWTSVKSTGDGGGWAKYTSSGTNSTCDKATASTSTYLTGDPTDQRLFECEYSQATSGSPTKTYATFRTAMKSAIASSGCATNATPATCLANVLQTELNSADTGKVAGDPTDTTTPAFDAHQYIVTTSNGTGGGAGTTKTIGTAPTTPTTGDTSFFTSTGTAASETPTTAPITLTVKRQLFSCYLTASPYTVGTASTYSGGKCARNYTLGWGDGSVGNKAAATQFATTVTNTTFAFTQGVGASYFPNMNDITPYNAAISSTNAPGDLYVEGKNQGDLSMIADNDAIVTSDVLDTSANANSDAIDIVAGDNVRNYHPVQCVDQTAADINATSPGWCPNDTYPFTGSSSINSDGTFKSTHPAAQYQDMNSFSTSNPIATCPQASGSTSTSPSNCREIDAAIFALGGSLLTDNFNRGNPMGSLAVQGGLYQAHRGANGVNWGYPNGTTRVPSSGASLQYHYINLQQRGLPFAPPSTTGSSTRPWQVVSVSDGSGSGS